MITGGPTHRLVIEGVTATVRYGYQLAAKLGAWKVEDGWLVARVEMADPYRLAQSPLTLEIPNQAGPPTERPLADVTVVQGQLSARLLPKGSS